MQQALEAGFPLLNPFRPGYCDGRGTRIVVRINDQQTETVIPMFIDRDKGQPIIGVSLPSRGSWTGLIQMLTK